MPEFQVVWRIEVNAENAKHAAQIALECQAEGSTARFFEVTDLESGDSVNVDLLED